MKVFAPLVTLLCSLFFIPLSARQINADTAGNVALNFYRITTAANPHIQLTADLSFTETESDGIVDFYVFNISPLNGFVIVSATNNVTPILAYSTESNFNSSFPDIGIKDWIQYAAASIHKTILQNIQASTRSSGLWNSYIQNQTPGTLKSTGVNPMLTTTWNQDPYYNMLCPYDNTYQSITGCVATGMAQIMKYWSYPLHGYSSFTYIDSVSKGFANNIGTLSANFGATQYLWANMPTQLNGSTSATDDSAVARLMYDCGVGVGMDYGSGESSAYFDYPGHACAINAFKEYFDYDSLTLQYVQMSGYDSAAWMSLIENELNSGRPVFYTGQDTARGVGHAWVCDGYDVNEMLHMNWGWGGYDNGYFLISDLDAGGYNLTAEQGAIIGIQPPTGPIANFAITTSVPCSGAYQFIDNSTYNPTSWLWNFGDGTNSTLQNPGHMYATNGTYTVSLKVANGYGSNTETLTNAVTVAKAVAPAVNDITNCSVSSFSLTVNTSNPVIWYDSTRTPVSHSNPFITPLINKNTIYWVDEWVKDSLLSASFLLGPSGNLLNNNIFALSESTNYIKLKFSVNEPVTLQSATVYSYMQGNKTVVCTDSFGNILSTATVYCATGSNIVNLNFSLLSGGPYYLGFTNDSMMEGTTTNVTYPYNDPTGAVTITGNSWIDEYGSAYSTWYPYFYNLTVSVPYCISETAQVTASIVPPAAPLANNVSKCSPSSFSLSASTSSSVFWYDSVGTYLSNSNPFNTQHLNKTTTFWVDEWVKDSSIIANYSVAPTGEAIAGGYFYSYYVNSNYFQLKFNVLAPVILQSAVVYAGIAENKSVQLIDSATGSIIASQAVYCAAGNSRIALNFNLPAGGPFYLGFSDDSIMEFTETGAVYPYRDANSAISITGSNFIDNYGSGYSTWYPYFYDWIVSEPYCISALGPVTAFVVQPDTTYKSATFCSGTNYNFYGTSLTAAGTYAHNLTSSIGCDSTIILTLSSVAESVGGTAAAEYPFLCSGDSTSISLSGFVGSIQWQSSSDSLTFLNISGAFSPVYNASVLSTTTYYRAAVKNAACNVANSSVAVVTVSPVSVGGNATAITDTICINNSATITASGNTGSIQWQSSTDNVTFTNINGATATTYVTPALNLTTYYRTLVTSGVCASSNSNTAIVIIDSASAGGFAASANDSVCYGNSTSIILTGNRGNIQWQSSPDNNTFTDINGSTSGNYTTPVLTATTYYRAVVTSGVCASVSSTTDSVIVNPVSVGGITSSTNSTLCSGSSATITLNGDTGSIQWQSSNDNNTFTNILGASSSIYSIPTLTSTTYYRAMVTSGVCAPANSLVSVINVDSTSISGTITAVNDSICAGTNAVMHLTGNTGGIQWKSSTDGNTFYNINGATSANYSTLLLSANTYYKVSVTNGVCPLTNSAAIEIQVLPLTTISVEPLSQYTCLGSSVEFAVTASGANLNYQWQKNSIDIAGAIVQSYLIDSVASSDAAQYSVSILGACGTLLSDIADLGITPNVVVSLQPISEHICEGGSVSFSIVANGTSTSYQWLKNGNNVIGATSSEYTISSAGVADSGAYICSVISGCGDTTSTAASLTVLTPSIYNYSQSICSNSNYNFNGRLLSASGIYYDTLQAFNSCDSLITLNLQLLPVYNQAINAVICPGTAYAFNGQNIATPGNYIDTLTSVSGCDSILTLILVQSAASSFSFSDSICAGDGYAFNGHNITMAGIYRDTLSNVNSCDSIVTLFLSSNPLPTVTLNLNVDTICSNADILTLNQGSPVGGVYAGVGVSGYTFDPSLVAPGKHVITYSYTGSNGCTGSDSSFIIVQECLGISEAGIDKLVSLYPNPTEHLLIGESALFLSENPVVLLYDITGRLLGIKVEYEADRVLMNVSDLAEGSYYIRLNFVGGVAVKEFTKIK